jgi:RNA polymerase sigma factor (sigma-70 family)
MLEAGFDITADRRSSPAAAADRREAKDELAAALLTLAPAVRAAIVLRHVDGLSVAETAEALGRAEGTIKAQVFRGLRELRLALEPAPDAPPTHPTRMRAAPLVPALEAIR